jgi:L-fuconolactonase
MPEFAVVDCHVHFYDPSRIDYPWLATVPPIDGTYLPREFDEACGTVTVDRIVFVEVDAAEGQAFDEAVFVASLAGMDGRIGGIVASARLERGIAAAEELDRLVTVRGIKGVRRLIQYHPEPDWCLTPSFVEGVGLLARYGLSFDICIRSHQLPSATELVRRCPDIQFVLDHIAKPAIKIGGWEPWASDLRIMASLPNVVCKMAGVATEADHANWTTSELPPYIEHAVECFGLSRLLFASDWPVMNLATTYPQWIALLDDILAGASEFERRRFYRDNAVQIYRLG